ncbi:FecR family protein [SAR92 clade bacterium H246]
MDNIRQLSTAEDIEQQAADWLVRLDSDHAPSQQDLQALKEWMQRSPAHTAQLKRLTKYWHSANLLTELSFPLPGSQRPDGLLSNLRYQFRQLLTHGRHATATLGIAFTLTLAVAMGLYFNSGAGVSGNGIYQTRIGEQNSITLIDGSVIQLNTNSRLQVNYDSEHRDVVLMAGEAHFEVAKEPSRPFAVKAGEGLVRAVGTAFSVRINPEALKVTVTEGKVALRTVEQAQLNAASLEQTNIRPADNSVIATAEPPAEDRGYLVQGQSVDFQPQASSGLGNPIQQLKQHDIEQQLAWRKGLLLFAGEPLAQVIQEVNRYTKLDIQIIDADIADLSIGGQFKVGETQAMLKVLETSFGIQVSRPNATTVHLALN